jgi:hypothetical protein
MHTTDYRNTFIQVSPDTKAVEGVVPQKPGTVAAMQYERLSAAPYATTSDDLLFDIHAQRSGVEPDERDAARETFFSKGQPCLRSSPLVKSHGWGVHFDAEGRIGLHATGSADYEALAARSDLVQLKGMRTSRA